jgi:hypothetical protein
MTISRIIILVWHVECVEATRNIHSILVGKPEGKRPPGRPKHEWKKIIKMELGEIGGLLD